MDDYAYVLVLWIRKAIETEDIIVSMAFMLGESVAIIDYVFDIVIYKKHVYESVF